MAAQMINVRLSRVDAQPWGLRLQGGKDFGTPLVIQKVNMGSIADQAGLNAGDSVISVNNVDVYNLRHKDAQDIIVRSGNSFDITVQRGGSTWRPHVTPTGTVPSPTPMYGGGGGGGPVNTVTKTSLAHKQPQQDSHIGCGYNNAARPFSSQNGGPVQSIVNKQYNTPVGMYSEESIAETLSAQAEVLAGGVLGVNFKKNEKVYNSAGSEVLKALQESENDPADPDETTYKSSTPHTKHVSAPVDRPNLATTGGLPTGQNICAECERLIVGVFVRIKDKNLHVDCFKCATCGTSLKNQGYFNLNNKLYCDIHAKMAAINNPPPGTEGFRPVPIQPNTKLSANTISAALNAHHPSQNGFSQNHDNVITQQSHSRTSSSASSVGSSYQSSTDSSKASPSKSSSPIHTRKGSHSNVQHQDNNNEWHKNGNSTDATDNKSTTTIINSNSKNNNGILPHYQIKLSTKYDAEDDDNITNSNNVKISDLIHELEDNLNPTTKATMNGIHKNVITDNNNHDNVPDSIYGTIRPHNKNRFNDDGGDDEFNYITLGGRTIRSVHPPGKGKHIQYKVNSNIGAPKPFGISNVPRSTGGPPMAGPKSPSSYPPSTNPSVWATQPKQPSTFASPKLTTANYNNSSNYLSNTLPRAVSKAAPDLPDLNDVSVNQKRVTSSPPPPPPSSTTVFPRPHTPSSSVINKPAPTIPYYQQNLVAEKCSASESHLFDPHLNSPSPHPDRTKSPAPGPPPNPLKIQAPRIKSPTAEKSLPIYSQMNYSNVQTEYLPNYSNGTISQTQDRPFDNYQSLAESGQRTFIDRPETFEQRQTTDGLNVQMRSKEQELNEQNRSNYESSVTQQFGNTQVQRKTRVVEEFEHTQKAKNIEIRKYSGNDPSMTKSITQPQQFSITDGERKIVTKQQQSQQPYGKVFYDHGYGKTGFVNSQTRRLSANSQYKSDLANYESHFPELSSPAPSPTQFPIRNFHPILEEPKVQSYNVLLRERTPEPTTTPTAQFSTLPLQPISSCNSNTSYCPTQSATVSSTSTLSSSHHQQIQNQTYNEMDFSKSSQKQIHNDSYLSSTLTNPKTPTAAATTKTLTTPSVPPPNPSMFKGPSQLSTTTPNNNNSYPIPLPYIKSHQTANDFMQNQNALNFKPTSTSDSGFRPSNTNTNPSAVVTDPSPASAGSNKGLTFGATSAPKRGRGIINKAALPGGRIPQCGCCNAQIRGPFITALGRIWCPDHFVCVNANCRRPLQDIGFVEEKGDLYCEYCFEKYLAPPCDKCGIKIKGDCLNAIGKHFHPECFTCTYCGKLFGNSPFFLEEGQAYCENDWNELFTTKCFACGFPVEAGDRWVEALSHNYHSQCFNCTACKKNLEGQSFYAKGGRPFCKNHAR